MAFNSIKMKKTIYIFFLFLGLTSLKSFSQGNLQFNQVLSLGGINNVVNPNSGSYLAYVSQTFVVPSGKVWKIEHVGFFNNNGMAGVVINGRTTAFTTVNPQSAGTIWLKAGDQIAFGSSASQGDYFASIIEFNIVP